MEKYILIIIMKLSNLSRLKLLFDSAFKAYRYPTE